MSTKYLIATFIVLQTLNSSRSLETTLELVHVVFRHGPRTPDSSYPKDPHLNETYYPIGRGQLTNAGKQEAFEVGQWLRARYGDFLGPFYEPDVLHAQATWVQRTIVTLQTTLAGLYPTVGTPMAWDSSFDWQPIPVFAEPIDEDALLLQRTPCPRYHEALAEVMASAEVQADIKPFLPLMSELSQLTGRNISKPRDVQWLYLTLLGQQQWGLRLPSWTRDYFPGKMQFLTEQNFVYDVYTRELQKLKAGFFLRKMFNEMQQRRLGILRPSKRKLFIYTAHDTTLVAILSALKLWQRQFPEYSLMVIFELRRCVESGAYYVDVFLRRDGAADTAERLKVPQCQVPCPLERFIELADEVVLKDEDGDRCVAKDKTFVGSY